MGIARLWWAEDSDIALTESRLEALRTGQLSSWLWISWEESKDKDSSFSSLYREITAIPMFNEGKVVLVHGLPSCHAELSECLTEIPEGIVLIIIGGIAKNLKLYKAAKKLEKENLAKVDESFELTRSNAKQWIKERTKLYGGTIDDFAVNVLYDLIGPKPNLLDREISKMIMMSENKNISPFIAEEACAHSGDSDVMRFCLAIMNENRFIAHELSRRLVEKGENVHRICGYLMDWSRKLAIAESFGRSTDNIDKEKLEKLSKPDREDDDPRFVSVEEFNRTGGLGKQRLIPNTGALYYVCKELSKSNKPKDWGTNLVATVAELIVDMRKGKEADTCFHRFVEKAISGSEREEDGTDNN